MRYSIQKESLLQISSCFRYATDPVAPASILHSSQGWPRVVPRIFVSTSSHLSASTRLLPSTHSFEFSAYPFLFGINPFISHSLLNQDVKPRVARSYLAMDLLTTLESGSSRLDHGPNTFFDDNPGPSTEPARISFLHLPAELRVKVSSSII